MQTKLTDKKRRLAVFHLNYPGFVQIEKLQRCLSVKIKGKISKITKKKPLDTADIIEICRIQRLFGADDRARTGTSVTSRDFKSLASAYSATSANFSNLFTLENICTNILENTCVNYRAVNYALLNLPTKCCFSAVAQCCKHETAYGAGSAFFQKTFDLRSV